MLTSYSQISLYQQSSYHLNKYKKIIINYYKLSLIILIRILYTISIYIIFLCEIDLLGFLSLFLCLGLFLFSKKNVLKLKLTKRCLRFIVVFLILISLFLLSQPLLCFSLLLLLPILIVITHVILLPVERIIYNYYYSKAKTKLNKLNLLNIGITGSYGKTSVKNFLYEIISTSFYTIKSPSSYNTPMGLSQVINKNINKLVEIFISELGATKPNDINELVNLIPIEIGILTDIGYQHMESFKTIENVLKTKLEILNSKNLKKIYINNDNKLLREYSYPIDIEVIRIGTTIESDLIIKDVQMNFNYLEFVIIYKNQEYNFQTKLLGRHNVFNLGLSIALSFDLGLDYKNIYENIRRIKAIPNRLELKKFNNIQIIDDAFNSNVKGFENALEVLLLTPYIKIIITPGVVELNESNYYLLDGIIETIINNNILFYGIENKSIKYFINSFNHFKYDKYILFESFIEAYNYATKDSKLYKTILIENDLTDYYLGG